MLRHLPWHFVQIDVLEPAIDLADSAYLRSEAVESAL
jgi:hypothetical protein